MNVTLVTGSDWQGIYVDGELQFENHSLAPFQVLDALGVDYDQVTVTDTFFEKSGGRLPYVWKHCSHDQRNMDGSVEVCAYCFQVLDRS